ncbi:MAG: nucleoside deaminase [Candidatus Electrothrix sp. ATG1]|nr:nucleoside deaminase [Candidatus Electrothrix sp. ATG1]
MDEEGQEAQDFYFMGKAIEFAVSAATIGEVPVGAVLVNRDQEILAGAGNNCIQANDPTGHAEIHTLRAAAEKLKNYRLPETTMYVTLEPCAMCATAMIQARVERIVFGATDPKGGAVQSLYSIGSDGKLNHRFMVTGGVRGEECAALLQDFFRQRRKKGE